MTVSFQLVRLPPAPLAATSAPLTYSRHRTTGGTGVDHVRQGWLHRRGPRRRIVGVARSGPQSDIHPRVDAVFQKPWLSCMLRSFCDTSRLMIWPGVVGTAEGVTHASIVISFEALEPAMIDVAGPALRSATPPVTEIDPAAHVPPDGESRVRSRGVGPPGDIMHGYSRAFVEAIERGDPGGDTAGRHDGEVCRSRRRSADRPVRTHVP